MGGHADRARPGTRHRPGRGRPRPAPGGRRRHARGYPALFGATAVVAVAVAIGVWKIKSVQLNRPLAGARTTHSCPSVPPPPRTSPAGRTEKGVIFVRGPTRSRSPNRPDAGWRLPYQPFQRRVSTVPGLAVTVGYRPRREAGPKRQRQLRVSTRWPHRTSAADRRGPVAAGCAHRAGSTAACGADLPGLDRRGARPTPNDTRQRRTAFNGVDMINHGNVWVVWAAPASAPLYLSKHWHPAGPTPTVGAQPNPRRTQRAGRALSGTPHRTSGPVGDPCSTPTAAMEKS